MASRYHTKNGRTSRRGAFVDGIWHCDCEPRMPAEKFQTKNGGKNHGRWFYTCQKPQPRRCPFFLWSDDAKIREESALLNNTRTEPDLPGPPQTPKKPMSYVQPSTPVTAPRIHLDMSPSKKSPDHDGSQTTEFGDEESFDWSSSGDEDLAAIAEAVTRHESESPRKAPRTSEFDSPGKRKHSEMIASSTMSGSTWPLSDDIFLTPTTSTKSNGLMSPISSKTKHIQPLPRLGSSSDLVSDVLKILQPANLSNTVEQELVELLDRYELRTQGIARGRDITRLAVQSKEKKIAELQARIAGLEADRETTRTVIAHLKQDIATSPKRSKKPNMAQSRYEV